MKTSTPAKKTTKQPTHKTVLTKDRTGRFFAIPQDQAKQFLVPAKGMAAAKAFYDAEVEGQSRITGPFCDPETIGGDFILEPGTIVPLDPRGRRQGRDVC